MNRSLALAFYLCSAVAASADGYPFHPDTQEVTCNHLRLKLTEDQQLEVAALGRVTLTKRQLELLWPYYGEVPPQFRAIAATFNDGLDIRDPNPVDCIWITPNEIAVTLREKQGDGNFTFDAGEHALREFDLRISPKGQLFHLGKEITREQALDLITKTTKTGNDRFFSITKAPPYRSGNEDLIALNKKADELFNAFVQHGEKHGVQVNNAW